MIVAMWLLVEGCEEAQGIAIGLIVGLWVLGA